MEASQSTRLALNDFLASVERRAFIRTKLAVSNSNDALDIVQDAMIKLVNTYADRPQTEWPMLFHKIVETQTIDWHRRQSVRNRWRVWLEDHSSDSEVQAISVDELAVDELPTQLEQLMLSRSMAELKQALAALSLRQRQVFLLRVWEGLSVAETASVMACSSGSVKTHLFRAVTQLQENISEYDHGL